jgi:hypothetical protein
VAKPFRANSEYVVRELTEEERQSARRSAQRPVSSKDADWGVFKKTSPDKIPAYTCVWPIPDNRWGIQNDVVDCGLTWNKFSLNTSVLRYQPYYQGGYIDGRDNNADTPYIEIGRCNERD